MKELSDILKSKKLLYVEDEIEILQSTEKTMGFFFQSVFTASDAKEALQIFEEENIDIIILDINIGDVSGIDVAKKIREKNLEVPIIFLTAHNTREFLYDAIKIKVEDYLIKPSSLNDMLAVFEKIYKTDTRDKIYNLKSGQTYNLNKRVLSFKEEIIKLGFKEEKLLTLLTENINEIVLKKDIDKIVWNDEMTENSYRNLLRNLRQKIGEESLHTIPGVGVRVMEK